MKAPNTEAKLTLMMKILSTFIGDGNIPLFKQMNFNSIKKKTNRKKKTKLSEYNFFEDLQLLQTPNEKTQQISRFLTNF